jgi:hypothetical protein
MMSETEKKGSPWPWILVPIAAFTLFFVLRECQKRLPPAVNATPAITTPATEGAPAPAASSASGPEAAAPAATPAPQ